MSRWVTISIGLLAAIYAVCLFTGALRTVDLRRAEAERDSFGEGERLTLDPLALRQGESSRTRELRMGHAHLRQSCDASRCEVFAGFAGQGYRLLASYPQGQRMELRNRGGEVELARLGWFSNWRRPPSASPWWLGAATSGLLLLALLFGRLASLGRWLAELRHARPVRVRVDGSLFFLDGRERGPARPTTPLPEGDGCALFSLAAPQGETYREGAEERWVTIAGLPEAHRAAAQRWRGACEAGLVVLFGSAILVCGGLTWLG